MDATTIIVALIAAVSSSGVWTYILARHNDKIRENGREDAERQLVIALARITLIQTCITHIHRGSISVEEADALTELYTPYAELGGNGNAERLFNQAINLPVRHGREEER